jgi:MoxR-like ATPase
MRNLEPISSGQITSANAVEQIERLQRAVETVIKGKSEAIRLAIVTLMAGGHLLVEDVPGVGKTTLAHALARALHCSFQRIQFTSDLLPSDVIGLSVYNQHSGFFEWKPGPVFANVVLADEINRTTPKTQSALLEAMAERHVTVEGATHNLPAPFIVLATQNPIEHHGTYPLPESQLDRFMLRLRIGYPAPADEQGRLRALKRVRQERVTFPEQCGLQKLFENSALPSQRDTDGFQNFIKDGFCFFTAAERR